MCRSNIDPKNPRRVLAEDLVLNLRRQLWVAVLRRDLLGYREGLEGLDLPMRRPDHWSVSAPQNVIGAEAVEQISDENSIYRAGSERIIRAKLPSSA